MGPKQLRLLRHNFSTNISVQMISELQASSSLYLLFAWGPSLYLRHTRDITPQLTNLFVEAPKKEEETQEMLSPRGVALATSTVTGKASWPELLKGCRKLHLSKMTLSSAMKALFSIRAQIGEFCDNMDLPLA